MVNIGKLKAWLQYLICKPLYKLYDVTVNNSFFNGPVNEAPNLLEEQNENTQLDDISESIPIEDSLTAQQQTLL